MTSSKQETLANAVLNVTVFKKIPGKDISIPTKETIDIAGPLNEKGVGFYQIHGISTWAGEDEYGCTPVDSRFVIDDAAIRNLGTEIENIMDAAIVNSTQAKAVKKLINDKICTFIGKQWSNF